MKQSVNPYNGDELYSFEELTAGGLLHKVNKAQMAFEAWKGTGITHRADLLRNTARKLRHYSRDYATTICLEMGKPISQAMAEVEKCAWVCEYYAETAGDHLAEEFIETDASKSFVRYEPLGVVLAIMPWNYPFWQVFRFAAPALMAGNIGLLKHASNVWKSAMNIEEVFLEAGLPEGCFQQLCIGTEEVEGLLKNKAIKAVTLTGSKPAGASVASMAGSQIKKSVLELGGSNALLVFEDADLKNTLDTCVQSRFQNTGQSCIAGKRLLLQRGITKKFVQDLTDAVRGLKSGDPMAEDTFIGVLAREDLAQDLERQIRDSVKKGAKILTGGQRRGTYFEPTLVGDVTPDMAMFKEETFGPALGITLFDSEEEGVALVNKSEFGLGVSVFTSSKERAERLVPQFDEGAVFINELVKSDPRLPFGGVKTSGYGRELSRHGILEFVNKKTVYYNF